MKKITVSLLIVLGALVAACDHHGSEYASAASLGAPSSTLPPANTSVVDLNLKCTVQIVRYVDQFVTVNIYGNVQLCLAKQLDPGGGNIRLRVYAANGTFKTFTVGIYNGSPIGNTNVTTIQQIPTPTSIDFTLTLEPRGCAAENCWVKFTLPSPSQLELLPVSAHYDRVQKTNLSGDSELHIIGALPPVGIDH